MGDDVGKVVRSVALDLLSWKGKSLIVYADKNDNHILKISIKAKTY